MAKTRQRKEAEVARFASGLREAKAIVFADLSSLKVNENSQFRRSAEKAKVDVSVAKKTLLRIALKDANIDAVDIKNLSGSVSFLVGLDDAVAPAKTVDEFRKTHESVKILGGLLDGKWMTAAEVTALAKLPSKEQLIAQVVGTIRAPLSGLVNTLQGNLRNLVYVMNAIKESKSV